MYDDRAEARCAIIRAVEAWVLADPAEARSKVESLRHLIGALFPESRIQALEAAASDEQTSTVTTPGVVFDALDLLPYTAQRRGNAPTRYAGTVRHVAAKGTYAIISGPGAETLFTQARWWADDMQGGTLRVGDQVTFEIAPAEPGRELRQARAVRRG